MPFRSKVVVLCAILFLPARLLGQFDETLPINLQTVSNTANPLQESVDHTPVHCNDPAALAACCGLNDGCGNNPYFESVFMFAGQLSKRAMGKTTDVFAVPYDPGFIVGIGYQRFPWSTKHFYWGWEVGVAGRSGRTAESVEGWTGLVLRPKGFTIGELVTVTPSLTAGFSAVTATQGEEHQRELGRTGDATFLFYLGPEFAISSPRCPNLEVFYRLHHRCGAGGTLGELYEGYNANVLGLRYKF